MVEIHGRHKDTRWTAGYGCLINSMRIGRVRVDNITFTLGVFDSIMYLLLPHGHNPMSVVTALYCVRHIDNEYCILSIVYQFRYTSRTSRLMNDKDIKQPYCKQHMGCQSYILFVTYYFIAYYNAPCIKMTNLNIASVHDRRGPYYADRNKTCCHLEGLIAITYRPPRDTCSLLNYDSMWRPLYRCQSINMTKGIVLDSRYTGTLTCILQNGHSYTCPQIPGWHEGGETSSRHRRDIQLENATGPYTTPNEGEIATNVDLDSGISTGDIIKTFSTETHAGIHIISWTRHFLLDSHDHTLDVCLSYDHSLGTYIYIKLFIFCMFVATGCKVICSILLMCISL